MHWIALQPPPAAPATAWGWQGLRFTPRVARVDEALLLEVSASWRLFGGPQALLRALLAQPDAYEIVTFDDARKAPPGLAQLAPAW